MLGIIQQGVIHFLAPIDSCVETVAVECERRQQDHPEIDVIFGCHNVIGSDQTLKLSKQEQCRRAVSRFLNAERGNSLRYCLGRSQVTRILPDI